VTVSCVLVDILFDYTTLFRSKVAPVMIECFPLIVLSERIERVVRSRKHTGVCNHNLLPVLSYLSASEGFVNSRCRNTQGIGDLRLCIAGGQHCFSTG